MCQRQLAFMAYSPLPEGRRRPQIWAAVPAPAAHVLYRPPPLLLLIHTALYCLSISFCRHGEVCMWACHSISSWFWLTDLGGPTPLAPHHSPALQLRPCMSSAAPPGGSPSSTAAPPATPCSSCTAAPRPRAWPMWRASACRGSRCERSQALPLTPAEPLAWVKPCLAVPGVLGLLLLAPLASCCCCRRRCRRRCRCPRRQPTAPAIASHLPHACRPPPAAATATAAAAAARL